VALTAVVHLTAGRLELARHPADGRVIAFEHTDDAFAFAVSFELGGALSAGTVAAPEYEQFHLVERGVTALDLYSPLEIAA
jgi:hypothetical protein